MYVYKITMQSNTFAKQSNFSSVAKRVNQNEAPVFPYPTLSSIARVVGVPQSSIVIIDHHPKTGTVMIGPKSDTPIPDHFIGSIWAFVEGKAIVVMSSSSHPIEIVSNTLSFGMNDSVRHYFETDGGACVVSDEPFICTIGTEGFYVRLGRFRGHDLFANRKKIDATASMWGDANFAEEYKRVGGPTHDALFEDTFSSNLSYAFMVTTQPTVTGTRQVLKTRDSGYVTFLGSCVNWQAGLFAYKEGEGREYGGSIALPRFFPGSSDLKEYSYTDFPGSVSEPLGLIAPVAIPEGPEGEEIQKFLQWGYFNPLTKEECPDPRMNTGETVMIISGKTTYKIVHPSFAWRNQLRRNERGAGGDPKLMNPFYRSVISNFKSQEEYDRWFLPIEALSMKAITDHLATGEPLVWIPPRDISKIYDQLANNVSERRRVAFVNFLLSVPAHSQPEVVEIWKGLDEKLQQLTKFIQGLQRGDFHFVDVSEKSEVVTRLSTKVESAEKAVAEGHQVARGMNGWFYIIDKIGCPVGKHFVLLTEPHHAASRIAYNASEEAKGKSQVVRGDKKQKYATWNVRSINRQIDHAPYNHVYQMVRQLDAVQNGYFY